MKSFFDPCVNRTLELIDGQVAGVLKRHGVMPKVSFIPDIATVRVLTITQMVLVVGGFGRNEYLFSKITQYCKERNMTTRKPQFP